MNQVLLNNDFYNQIKIVCRGVEKVSAYLNTGKREREDLLIKTYELFLKALNLVEHDNQLKSYPQYFRNRWIGRLYHFEQLSGKLSGLALLMSKTIKDFDQENLPAQVLKYLSYKVKFLSEKVWTQGRLPIYYDDVLEERKKQFNRELNLEEVSFTSLEIADKETFHILASRFQQLKEVKKKSLEGFSLSRSLLLIINLVNQVLTHSSGNQEKKRALLHGLQGALKIALKLDVRDLTLDSQTSHSNYFEKLSIIEIDLEVLERNAMTSQHGWNVENQFFFSPFATEEQKKLIKAFLSYINIRRCDLPNKLCIHDVTWDIIQSIQLLKDKEFILVPLGTKEHLVIAQVECHVVKGIITYDYLLFNTGDKCDEYHLLQTLNKHLYVKPLKIVGIKREGLSYRFWNQALNCFLHETDIALLYQLQEKHLIGEGKGIRQKRVIESSYRLPNFGICAYSATEMVVFSHLDKSDKTKLDIVKAIRVVKQQIKVMNFRKLLVDKAKRNHRTMRCLKLKQSQILFQHSRKYLKRCVFYNNKLALTQARPLFSLIHKNKSIKFVYFHVHLY